MLSSVSIAGFTSGLIVCDFVLHTSWFGMHCSDASVGVTLLIDDGTFYHIALCLIKSSLQNLIEQQFTTL